MIASTKERGPAVTALAPDADTENPGGVESASAGGTIRSRLHALFGPDSRLRQRFIAWWEGYYLPDDPKPEPEAAPAKPAPAASHPPVGDVPRVLPDRWSAERVKISELIWSDGFSFPGGADHVLKLVKPMGLSKEKSMLDLGSGLGGAARVIAKSFGTWVTGMEASPTLAKAGMDASERAGLGKKAPIEWFDPLSVELPAKKYDAIFARLVFLCLANKKRLLGEIHKALKGGGQLMFLEFVVTKKGANSKALADWIAGEDHRPELYTLDEYSRDIRSLNFDLRVAEDITDEFRGLVLDGWKRLADTLKPKSLRPEEAMSLTHEVELWSRRVAAFDAGDLRCARLYALKKVTA
ncbi:MAG TPA: methyltransferase domain-containing protein [Alphaproteobacteria bacterium]